MCETAPTSALTPDVLQGYDLLRASAGRLSLTEIVAVEVAGEDRKGWLQGQITNDLRNFQEGGSIQFCLCSPTGQLIADGTLWALPGRFLLTVPRAAVDAVLQRFEAMVILEDVSARVLDTPVVSLQGPDASRQLGSVVPLPSLDAGVATVEDGEVVCLRSNRTGYGGWDVITSSASTFESLERIAPEISEEAYHVARLEAGIPLFGSDTGPKTLPPEMGDHFVARHVSYSKGCYTGQEVLMRIHSRGHTNRTWMALVADEPMAPGAKVMMGKTEVGYVTSAAESPVYGFIAGAMLRNEAATPGQLAWVDSPGGSIEAEVDRMPLLRLG